MKELDFIEGLRALADPLYAQDFRDDVALMPASTERWIVTQDALVEGVHFLLDEARLGLTLAQAALKALAVNVSDVYAKGCRPAGYLLSVAWPRRLGEAEHTARFLQGLAEGQERWAVRLWGGDTTATPGLMNLSVTMFGAPLNDRAPIARMTAQPGEDLWVAGKIGDGVLGLKAVRGEIDLAGERPSPAEAVFAAKRAGKLAAHYMCPELSLHAAEAVASWAMASMDVSDGLIIDARRMAAASGARIEIERAAVPLSLAGARWLALQADRDAALGELMEGGDDYAVLFTAQPQDRGSLEAFAARAGIGLSRIGRVLEGKGVTVLDEAGSPVVWRGEGGWTHASF